MQHARPFSHVFKTAIVTALSWLGLSGLADSIVEWKNWYELGIIQHWRSFKEFIYEKLLFWVPFEIPDWSIDYLLLGVVFARAYWSAQSNEFREVAALGTTKDYYVNPKLREEKSKLWVDFQLELRLGPVDNHLEAMRAATRFQHAA